MCLNGASQFNVDGILDESISMHHISQWDITTTYMYSDVKARPFEIVCRSRPYTLAFLLSTIFEIANANEIDSSCPTMYCNEKKERIEAHGADGWTLENKKYWDSRVKNPWFATTHLLTEYDGLVPAYICLQVECQTNGLIMSCLPRFPFYWLDNLPQVMSNPLWKARSRIWYILLFAHVKMDAKRSKNWRKAFGIYAMLKHRMVQARSGLSSFIEVSNMLWTQ